MQKYMFDLVNFVSLTDLLQHPVSLLSFLVLLDFCDSSTLQLQGHCVLI